MSGGSGEETAPEAAQVGYTLPDVNRWLVLAVMSISAFIVFADGTVVNTALPAIARDFEASTATLQWVADGYILILAGLLLVGGTLGDKFGRRRWLGIGMVVFGVGAVGGALSPSAASLIFFRGVQGLGAALILPATLSIVTAVFPRHERSKAIGIWTGVGGLGVAFGPVAGGFLVDNIDWSAVFWLLVPFVVLALLGLRFVPESRDTRQLRVDVPGAVLVTTGLIALVFAIIQGNEDGWSSPLIIGVFVLAAVLLAGFVVVESRSDHPMLPLQFFRERDFTGAVIIIGLAFFAMFGIFFFMTQYFQLVQGRSALQAGLLIVPAALALGVSSPIAGILSERVGPKILAVTSMILIGLGMLVLAQLEVESGVGLPIGGLFLFGFGLGLGMAPLTDTVMAAVPVNDAGVGSAVNDMSRELGGALGVALIGAIVTGLYRSDIEEALTGLVPDSLIESASEGIAVLEVSAAQLPSDVAALVIDAADTAFVDALTTAMLISTGFMVLAVVVAATLIPWKMRDVQASERRLETVQVPEAPPPLEPEPIPVLAAVQVSPSWWDRFVGHCYGMDFVPWNRCS